MAKEEKNVKNASVGEIGNGKLLGVVDGILKQIETDKSGGLMTFDKGVSKSDINVENGVTGFNPIGEVKEGDKRAVSGDEVYKNTLKYNDVGIIKNYAGQNILADITNKPIDSVIFQKGFIDQNGVLQPSESYISTMFSQVLGGNELDLTLTIAGNACVVFYGENKQVISFIKKNANDGTNQTFNRKQLLDENVKYYKMSFNLGLSLTENKASYTTDVFQITDEVFLPTSEFNPVNTASKLKQWGQFYFEPNQNFIADLANSNYNDENTWKNGYLNQNGEITDSTDWKYSVKLYVIPQNKKLLSHLYFNGNACLHWYDKNNEYLGFFKNPNTPSEYIGELNTPKGAYYFRTSYPNFQEPNLSKISLSINEYIYININEVEASGNSGSGFDKRQFTFSNNYPIVTIISDDFAVENDWLKDIYDQYKIKGTFAVVTDWLGKTVGQYSYMNYEDVIRFHNEGHDIAGHTHTHADRGLATWTLDMVNEELKLNSSILRSYRNDLKARMFIAPFGSRNVETDKILQQYFDTNFVTTINGLGQINNSLNQPPINRLRIVRVSIDAGTFNKSTIEYCKTAVRLAVRDGGWLVFAIHPHYAEYNTEHSVDKKAELIELIEYIQSFQIQILTAQQAYDIYKNKYELGNELIDPNNFYALGMNGAEKGHID